MNPLALLLGTDALSAAPQPVLPDYMGGINASLAANALKPNPQPQAAPVQGPSKFRNFLGAIGDALLVSHGIQPMYREQMQQRKQSAALQGFLTNPNQAIAQLMQIPGQAGNAIDLWKAVHPASEMPLEVKLLQYRKSHPEDAAGLDAITQALHPGMLAPITLGPNDTYYPSGVPPTSAGGGYNLPTVNDQKSYDAVPAGGQYKDPQGHIRTKGGATASTPSPTFR